MCTQIDPIIPAARPSQSPAVTALPKGEPRLSKKPRRVRGPQAANSVQSIFHGGAPKGTSVGRVRREKYFALASAQRNWPRQTRRWMSIQSVFSRILCVKTRGSKQNLFCQKRALPFFDKLKMRGLPPLIGYGNHRLCRWRHLVKALALSIERSELQVEGLIKD